MQGVTEKENLGLTGKVSLSAYRAGTLDAAMPFVRKFNEAKRAGKKGLQIRLFQRIQEILDAGSLNYKVASPNLIMTGNLTGRDLFVQYLIGGTIYTGINYAGIGTSNTATASTDTQLGAEVARQVVSLATDVSYNQAQIQFFFTDANLTNGTYKEVGSFMNASATLNSGKIFNRSVLGSNYVKTSSVDTTLELDFTLN